MTERPGRPAAGHRSLPHTADSRIEAWAPDRERCLAEAVTGLVGSFSEVPATAERRTATVRLEPAPDQDLLVELLEEVVYRLDAQGELPASVRLAALPGGGLEARLEMVRADAAQAVGAVPKAVSLHGLELVRDGCGWRCAFTVDV
ncbi:archease [Streptacidiphilus griseoplanus]|uniref:archease n=1 Tax=Peterkaempfera griseoplana TaxID=66896 RepID=UPI0006E2F29D|nr:archease [Peterkaempfera griseoplana]